MRLRSRFAEVDTAEIPAMPHCLPAPRRPTTQSCGLDASTDMRRTCGSQAALTARILRGRWAQISALPTILPTRKT